MSTVSIKIPDDMKRQIEQMSEEGLYQNDSEYIRAAIREKLEKDNGLTSEEEKEVLRRIKALEDQEAETVSLDDLK